MTTNALHTQARRRHFSTWCQKSRYRASRRGLPDAVGHCHMTATAAFRMLSGCSVRAGQAGTIRVSCHTVSCCQTVRTVRLSGDVDC
eukprot:5378565-Prymnesium_polylepis.1